MKNIILLILIALSFECANAQVKQSDASLSIDFATYIPFDSIHGVYVIPVENNDTIYGYTEKTRDWLFKPIYDSLATNFQGSYGNGVDFTLKFKSDTIIFEVKKDEELRYYIKQAL